MRLIGTPGGMADKDGAVGPGGWMAQQWVTFGGGGAGAVAASMRRLWRGTLWPKEASSSEMWPSQDEYGKRIAILGGAWAGPGAGMREE